MPIYSGTFRHNQTYLGIIQEYSGLFKSLCNLGLSESKPCSQPWYIQTIRRFRTLAYLEPWFMETIWIFITLVCLELCHSYSLHIQNPDLKLLTTLSSIYDRAFYKNHAIFVFALFSKIANRDLSETGCNKVELVFSIRKRNRFHKKPVFSWTKEPFSLKLHTYTRSRWGLIWSIYSYYCGVSFYDIYCTDSLYILDSHIFLLLQKPNGSLK